MAIKGPASLNRWTERAADHRRPDGNTFVIVAV
jgi:hypothetical protein